MFIINIAFCLQANTFLPNGLGFLVHGYQWMKDSFGKRRRQKNQPSMEKRLQGASLWPGIGKDIYASPGMYLLA